MTIPDGIGDRLRQERERLGLSQEEMGAATGLSRRTVFHYETERNPIPTEFFHSLAKIGGDIRYVIFAERASSVALGRIERLRSVIRLARETFGTRRKPVPPLDGKVEDWILRAFQIFDQVESTRWSTGRPGGHGEHHGPRNPLPVESTADDLALVKRAIGFARDYCRDDRGRLPNLDDEVEYWILQTYEEVAPAPSKPSAAQIPGAIRRARRA